MLNNSTVPIAHTMVLVQDTGQVDILDLCCIFLVPPHTLS